MTGTEMTRREDFKTLVADVSMGAVFALEVSRLACSNLDWHRLLELCASWALAEDLSRRGMACPHHAVKMAQRKVASRLWPDFSIEQDPVPARQ